MQGKLPWFRLAAALRRKCAAEGLCHALGVLALDADVVSAAAILSCVVPAVLDTAGDISDTITAIVALIIVHVFLQKIY